MKLDKPEHKQFLLEMIGQVSFPGRILDMAYEVKKAVEGAQLEAAEPLKVDGEAPAGGEDQAGGAGQG